MIDTDDYTGLFFSNIYADAGLYLLAFSIASVISFRMRYKKNNCGTALALRKSLLDCYWLIPSALTLFFACDNIIHWWSYGGDIRVDAIKRSASAPVFAVAYTWFLLVVGIISAIVIYVFKRLNVNHSPRGEMLFCCVLIAGIIFNWVVCIFFFPLR